MARDPGVAVACGARATHLDRRVRRTRRAIAPSPRRWTLHSSARAEGVIARELTDRAGRYYVLKNPQTCAYARRPISPAQSTRCTAKPTYRRPRRTGG